MSMQYVSKANKTLGLFKRNLSMCPQSVKLQASKGLIRPGLGVFQRGLRPLPTVFTG